MVIRWASLYHFVGAGEKRGRHGEAKRLSGFEIDHQFNFSALLDGEVSRPGALENFSDIDPCLPMQIPKSSQKYLKF